MRLRSALAPLVAAFVLAGCARDETPGGLVLHGGKVFTADTVAPWAEAVLIQGERIAAVGTDAAVLSGAPRNAVRVDLGGRTVVPGFNDAHDHIAASRGVFVATASDPLPDPSFALVQDSLRAAVAGTASGTWLRVAVGERVLSDGLARRAALDATAPNHPVELEAWTGHGAIYNSAALRALGIDESVTDPLGGRFERDVNGRLTGLAEEYARYARWGGPPGAVTDSTMADALRARADAAAAWGITTIQSMVTGMPPEALARILPALELPIRLRLVRLPLTTAAGRVTAGWDVLVSLPGSGVTVSGNKWLLDGTPVERLAAMREPYADCAGWHGRLNFPPDTLRAILREAAAANDQPLFHAVGDSAIGLVLATMAELAPDPVWRRLRPRVEHGDGLSPDQYDLARRLGVIVVQNPSHFALGPMAAERLGAPRLATFQPMRTLLANGIPVALGSDGPQDPFLNLMFATIHPDNPGEALTMDQAVRAYTWGSAVAEHAESEKGRLAPGQLADLAVLSQDIFTAPPPMLPGTTSVLTIVGGRVVHDPNAMVPELAPSARRSRP
jgi:predicted amidohydrolase YtcJ